MKRRLPLCRSLQNIKVPPGQLDIVYALILPTHLPDRLLAETRFVMVYFYEATYNSH